MSARTAARVRHGICAVMLGSVALGAGCVSHTIRAETTILGALDAPAPSPRRAPVRQGPPPPGQLLPVWIASGPPGLLPQGDTLLVEPNAAYEPMGVVVVYDDLEPSADVVGGTVFCSTLCPPLVPATLTYALVYALLGANGRYAASRPAHADAMLRLMRDEAHVRGADGIAFVKWAAADDASKVRARAWLLRARTVAPVAAGSAEGPTPGALAAPRGRPVKPVSAAKPAAAAPLAAPVPTAKPADAAPLAAPASTAAPIATRADAQLDPEDDK